MSKLRGRTVFTVSENSIKIMYVPGGGFRYHVDGHDSLHRYYDIASAKSDARKAQIVHKSGKIEPYESAQKYDRL
jgi:hypothetical protein